MGTADRPLILQNRQENSSFYSFLSYLLSSFLAIVFAWRIIFYKRTPETSIEDGNVQRDSDDTDAEDSSIDSEAFDSTVEVLHPNPVVTQEFLKKKSDPLLTRGLLKELARLGQDNQFRVMADDSLSSSSERSIISQVAKEMVQEARNEQNMSPETDADRDQDEELVYNEDRRKTQTMDDNLSLNSVSINLNATRDSLLNQSITSNPIDESSIMENTM